jgi:hypothetical protein
MVELRLNLIRLIVNFTDFLVKSVQKTDFHPSRVDMEGLYQFALVVYSLLDAGFELGVELIYD